MTRSHSSSTINEHDEWLAGLRQGNLKAFRALYEHYTPRLRRFARIWMPLDAAEDVVQDVFFDLWERRHEAARDTGNLSAYLYAAVRNKAYHFIRHQHVARRLPVPEVGEDAVAMAAAPALPDTEAVANDIHTAVRQAIAELPPLQRAVLMLRWTQSMSYADISATLGITENAAMQNVSRARKALRSFLE